MKSKRKDIYLAPGVSVDDIFNPDIICLSSDATNESFEVEIDIEW